MHLFVSPTESCHPTTETSYASKVIAGGETRRREREKEKGERHTINAGQTQRKMGDQKLETRSLEADHLRGWKGGIARDPRVQLRIEAFRLLLGTCDSLPRPDITIPYTDYTI